MRTLAIPETTIKAIILPVKPFSRTYWKELVDRLSDTELPLDAMDCMTSSFRGLKKLKEDNIDCFEIYGVISHEVDELMLYNFNYSYHAWLQSEEGIVDLFANFLGQISCAPSPLRQLYEKGKPGYTRLIRWAYRISLTDIFEIEER